MSDSALQEIFMDLYTKSVKDNEEDFTTLYWIIWKMASVLLKNGAISAEEYKWIMDIKNKEERDKEMEEMKNGKTQ